MPRRRVQAGNGLGHLAWKALAGIMFVNGSLGILAPRFLIRSLGVKPDLEPGMIYVFRMFGIRTLFIAIDLVRRPDERQRSMREGIIVHATDASVALTAAMLGQLPARPAIMVAGLSTLNTLLAVVGARVDTRPDRGSTGIRQAR